MNLEITLAKHVAESFPAAVALREANIAFAWDEKTDRIDAENRPVGIRSTAASESRPSEHRLNCASLLELIDWLKGHRPDGVGAIHQAVERTHIHSALRLLRILSTHGLGDPVVPITVEVRSAFTGIEAAITGPVFVPEQFVYVPALYFRGDEFSIVDAAFAGAFRAAERMGDHFWKSVASDCPKICSWKVALALRPTVRQASIELPP